MELWVGKSVSADANAAATEAVAEALAASADGRFALVFATTGYDRDGLVAALNRALGPLPWAGCCSSGVIAGPQLLTQGVVVAVLGGRDLQVSTGVAGTATEHPAEAGREATERALRGLPPLSEGHHQALILLTDSMDGSTASVVRGASHEGGSAREWAGGGTGDNFKFHPASLFAEGRCHRDGVLVVALDSTAPLGTGIRHGWRPYGPPTMVTAVEGGTITELDFENAFSVYRSTAADQSDVVEEAKFTAFAMMHPLGIPQMTGAYLIRDPLSVDAQGGLHCVAEVREGSVVRIMRSERDELTQAGMAAALEARANAGSLALGGGLLFDCVSRYLVFGGSLDLELQAVRAGLGPEVPLAGCLTFGEVGAFQGSVPQFHNKTAVVLALGKSAEAET